MHKAALSLIDSGWQVYMCPYSNQCYVTANMSKYIGAMPCTLCGFIHDGNEIDGPFKRLPIEQWLIPHYAEALALHMRTDGWSLEVAMRECFYMYEISPELR